MINPITHQQVPASPVSQKSEPVAYAIGATSVHAYRFSEGDSNIIWVLVDFRGHLGWFSGHLSSWDLLCDWVPDGVDPLALEREQVRAGFRTIEPCEIPNMVGRLAIYSRELFIANRANLKRPVSTDA